MEPGRKLIMAGVAVIVLSFAISFGASVLWLDSNVLALVPHETAGIGAVGGASLELALIATILGILSLLTGIALVVAGIVKSRKGS